MGTIINKHYSVVQPDVKILKKLFDKLNSAVTKKSYLTADGIVCWVTDCLIHMKPSEGDADKFYNLYQVLKNVTQWVINDQSCQRSTYFYTYIRLGNRRDILVSGTFKLLRTHINLFGKYMINEDKFWHQIFIKRLNKINEDAKAVLKLSLSFFQFMSSHVNEIDDYQEILKVNKWHARFNVL